MRAVGEADRPRGPRDLFHDDDVGEIAEVRTAKALGHGDAEQALSTQGRPQVARKFVAAVDVGGARGNPLRGEAPHLTTDLLEIIA